MEDKDKEAIATLNDIIEKADTHTGRLAQVVRDLLLEPVQPAQGS